jgi:tRNA threonylcarbamoyladenosine biosynthesis protein TsaE
VTVRRSTSVEETEALGRELGERLAPDGVLLLSGDLGTGKTVLARGVAAALGIDPAEVQSPTFTLMRSHRGRGGSLLHVDLYRLEPTEVPGLGLEEALHAPGVKVVEWAERLPFPLPGAVALVLRRGAAEAEREIEEQANPFGGDDQ